MTSIYLFPGNPPETRFPFGSLVATANAAEILEKADVAKALVRHGKGDWGELSADDITANEDGLKYGNRLLSAYRDSNSVKFWIITEADRSATTVLLPEDY